LTITVFYWTDSTFSFLFEQWKDHLPPGYTLKEASVDQPFEEDACRCHFKLVNVSSDSELVFKYQWYVGDRTPTNFVAIDNAVGEVLHYFSCELKKLTPLIAQCVKF